MIHTHPDLERKLDLILATLSRIETKEGKLMASEQQALDLLTKIDTATTAQGVVLTQEATTLQTISDEIDAFLANPPAGVPQDVIDALTAQADKVQAVSDSLTAQAAFSTQIAAKGSTTVPPVPPPTPPQAKTGAPPEFAISYGIARKK